MMVVLGGGCCSDKACVLDPGEAVGAIAQSWSTPLEGGVGTEVLLDAVDCVVRGAGGFGGGLPPEGWAVLS